MTSLEITDLTFDGSSIHVQDRTLCPTDLSWCCPSISAYENPSDICFLKNQNFLRPSTLDNIFQGFFILNGSNVIFDLNRVRFQNFYSIYNYNMLIFDSMLNSKIVIGELAMNNVFFLKGISTIDYLNTSNTQNFSFTSQNLTVLQWNYYNIYLEFGKEQLLSEIQDSNVLYAFSNATTISIQNSSILQSIFDILIILKNVPTFSLNLLSIQNSTFQVFRVINTNILKLSNLLIKNLSFKTIKIVYSGINVANLNISDSTFIDIPGAVIVAYSSKSNFSINNIIFRNTCRVIYEEDIYGIFHLSGEKNNVIISNIHVSNIYNFFLPLFTNYVKNGLYLINNSIFTNLKGARFGCIFFWPVATVSNCIFSNLDMIDGVFLQNPYGWGLTLSLTVTNSHFSLLTSEEGYGSITYVTIDQSNITFENSSFSDYSPGYSIFFPCVALNIQYNILDSNFTNLIFEKGVIFTLLNDQKLKVANCRFDNLHFTLSTFFRGIIFMIDSSCTFTQSFFSNL